MIKFDWKYPDSLTEGQDKLLRALRDTDKSLIYCIGGLGSGKTRGAVMALLYYVYCFPHKLKVGECWFVSGTHDQARVAIQHFTDFGYVEEGGIIIDYLKQSRTFLLVPPEGWKGAIRVCMKSGKDPNLLRGHAVDLIIIDEGARAHPDTLKVCQGRVARTNGKIIIPTTPDSFTHLYWEMQDNIKNNPQDTLVIDFGNTMSNKFVPLEGRKRLYRQYQGLWREQELEGKFVKLTGLTYRDFVDSVTGKDTQNVVFMDNDRKKKLLMSGLAWGGIDFGHSKESQTACVIGVEVDGNVYILFEHREAYLSNEDLVNIIKESGFWHEQVFFYADCANPRDIQQLNQLGLHTLPSIKGMSRMTPTRMVHALISTGRLKISGDCTELRRQLRVNMIGKDGMPMKHDDDLIDALRYMIASRALQLGLHGNEADTRPPIENAEGLMTWQFIRELEEVQKRNVGQSSGWCYNSS